MKRVAIIGGGASGLMAAITIKQLDINTEVTIYERQSKIGKKILQTGNGKCNLCNTNIDPSKYNIGTFRNLIFDYNYKKIISLFEKMGLMIKIDEAGRIYPYSEKATTVLDVLLREIERLNIKVVTDFEVSNIKALNCFSVYSTKYDLHHYDYVVMATGGLSSLTFVNSSYNILKALGHDITPLKPGLVALKVKEKVKSLSGLRIKAKVKVVRQNNIIKEDSGEVLFKDEGLSGIVIFELSRYVQKNDIISIDLIPELNKDELSKKLNELKKVYKDDYLMGILPKMIVFDIFKRTKSINEVIDIIKNYHFEVTDTYGYDNAQITMGGLSLKQINPDSFESLVVPNLYVVGEVLDIDGACGGYNLYFAWLSGYVAGLNIIKGEKER